jgi:hypothetical protein
VLFELRCDGVLGQYAKLLTSTVSQPFVVKEAKGVGISKASTPLTRAVAECGVKVRIRKEPTYALPRVQIVEADVNAGTSASNLKRAGDLSNALSELQALLVSINHSVAMWPLLGQ